MLCQFAELIKCDIQSHFHGALPTSAAGSSYSSSAIQDQLLQNALLNHAMRHSSLALPSSLHQRGDPFLSSITNTNTGTSGLGGLDILRGRAAGTAAPSILRHQLLAAAASQAQAHPRSSLGNTTALQQATALLRNNSVTNEQTRRQELQRILSENAQGLRRGQESGYLQRSNAQQRLLLDSQISQQLVGGLSVGYLQQILGRQTTPQMPSAAAANSARLSAMPSQPNHQLPGPGARAAAFVRSAYAERPTREPVTLYLSCDDDSLTPYQCLARKQIQLFECTAKDVDSASSSGRSRRGVRVGQVGIRCRHCSHLPQRERARGSTYYPTKLEVSSA